MNRPAESRRHLKGLSIFAGVLQRFGAARHRGMNSPVSIVARRIRAYRQALNGAQKAYTLIALSARFRDCR